MAKASSEGPYRGVALTAPSATTGITLLTPRRGVALVVVVGILLAARLHELGLAAALAGAAAGIGIIAASVQHGRALRRLERLPFAVHHEQPCMSDPFSLERVGIDEVELRIVHRLDGMATEAMASEAQRVLPGLRAATARGPLGDTFVLTGWQWSSHDLALLGKLLATWGVLLHDRASIASVQVRWRAGAPLT